MIFQNEPKEEKKSKNNPENPSKSLDFFNSTKESTQQPTKEATNEQKVQWQYVFF